MIHIITIHWKTDKWIDIQLKYFKEYIPSEFRVYTFLNDIPLSHTEKFFYCSSEPIVSHAKKLNLLADVALSNAKSEEDWLIFVDGDAFPIANLVSYGVEKLSSYPLIAVQRFENNGDIQPHPCFCLTTTGFWKSIQGDWSEGYTWNNQHGIPITDVGGNLLRILTEKNIQWYPLLRTNKIEFLPVSFGIYDNIIYHHGAGFRLGTTRMHLLEKKRTIPASKCLEAISSFLSFLQRINFPVNLYSWLQNLHTKWDEKITMQARSIARAEIRSISDNLYENIEKDFYFYKIFLS